MVIRSGDSQPEQTTMPLIESLIGPIASIIDKIIPDKEARAKAKLELLALEGTHELK